MMKTKIHVAAAALLLGASSLALTPATAGPKFGGSVGGMKPSFNSGSAMHSFAAGPQNFGKQNFAAGNWNKGNWNKGTWNNGNFNKGVYSNNFNGKFNGKFDRPHHRNGFFPGFAAGAAVGAFAAGYPYYDYSYYDYPYYGDDYAYDNTYTDGGYTQGYVGLSSPAECAAHFRSYDPASQTYLGYDGIRHPCP
jgi:BA14K-like protein